MLARLKAVLPARWFSDQSPTLDGILSGLASAWAGAYALLQYVKAQTRIASATDVWLDVIAEDFFGSRVKRQPGQADPAFRLKIRGEIFRERGTRAALISVLKDTTGREPIVFEPANTTDTGGYGTPAGSSNGLGYGVAGGWGSLDLPFQCFVTAYRPIGTGIALVSGWGGSGGGFGRGAIEYASLMMIQGQVTDPDIYAAIAGVLPAASIAWTKITN